MSVLQYVGARYVPKLFDDGKGGMEWQPNTYYEPLTIVTYNNASYISRVPVAATIGNPVENNSFWANTGNYNGFVAALDERLTAAEALIAKNTNDASRALSNLKKKVLWIGDSYSEGQGVATSFIERVKETLVPMGWTINIAARGGAGFVGLGTTFLSLLESAPVNDYDLIYVQGIGNDIGKDISAALAQFVSACAERYPGVPIVVLPVTKNVMQSNFGDISPKLNQCVSNGMGVVFSAYNWLIGKDRFQSDGVHPNTKGHDLLYHAVMNLLTGNSISITARQGPVNYYYADYNLTFSTYGFTQFLKSWVGETTDQTPVVMPDSLLGVFPFYNGEFSVNISLVCKINETNHDVYIVFYGVDSSHKVTLQITSPSLTTIPVGNITTTAVTFSMSGNVLTFG